MTVDEKRQKMWDKLLELDTETALQILIDCYGRQLLSNALYEHMAKEGYIEDDPDEGEEE